MTSFGFDIATAFRGRHVLVTGSRGFLAHSLMELLRPTDCRVRCLSRGAAPSGVLGLFAGSSRLDWQRGDLRDATTWQRAVADVDTIFHLAAQTSAEVADGDLMADIRANVLPLVLLLEACRHRGGCPTVLLAGTVTQAGVPRRLPVDETHPDEPLTNYDRNKCVAERYLEYFLADGVVRGATLRLPNLYGPGPASSAADRGMLNRMVARAMAGDSLTIYGDGAALRDYLFVEDAARAFLMAAAGAHGLTAGHYVLGTGHGHSLAEAIRLVAECVSRRTGRGVPVVDVEPPSPPTALQSRDFIGDATLFRQATGWEPRYDLRAGIERMIEP